MPPGPRPGVEVATARATIDLSTDARRELLARLRDVPGAEEILRRFDAAGTTVPVRLEAGDRTLLLQVVDEWCRSAGPGALPAGIRELRDTLAADEARGDLEPGAFWGKD